MTSSANIKQRFFHSLKRGTGEAYLLAKNNPGIDFSNLIIKGAVRNYAYDGQSEDSRAQYVFDLIALSVKKEKIRKAVLNGLATEQSDTWSLTHLFDLAKLYAQQGDPEARKAIYERFLTNPIEGSDWVGYSEILELDGFQGLVFIAEKTGKLIDKNPGNWQDDAIISHFQADNPTINVSQELEKLSETNHFISLYLDCIRRTKESRKNHVRETQTFKDIVDETINSKPFISFKRKKELNQEEINQLAAHLLKEKNKVNIEKLLGIFTTHKFPADSAFILKLANQKRIPGLRIKEFAIGALKFLKSAEIRQFALDNIPKAKLPGPYIDILISNYKKGDGQLLKTIADKFKNEHAIEQLAAGYVGIFKANKTKECKEPLEALYNKMNCGIHRHLVIQVLMENNVLSDTLKNEIKYDSYLETRALAHGDKTGT